MKKISFALGMLLALGFAGCGSKDTDASDPNLLVNSDFESLAGWLSDEQAATLSRDKAHSGRYSLKIDGTHEYSLTYKSLLGTLHSTRIKKMNISAWAMISTADAKASLVAAVSNPANPNEKPLLWDAIEVGKNATPGKWVKISKVITVPESATPSSTLSLYLWRTDGYQPVYIDDLLVTLEP